MHAQRSVVGRTRAVLVDAVVPDVGGGGAGVHLGIGVVAVAFAGREAVLVQVRQIAGAEPALAEGLGSAVQGNPLTAVAWLANTLGEFGIPFKAGEVILSGSLAPLIPVVPGDEMRLEIEGVGGCSCQFV